VAKVIIAFMAIQLRSRHQFSPKDIYNACTLKLPILPVLLYAIGPGDNRLCMTASTKYAIHALSRAILITLQIRSSRSSARCLSLVGLLL